MVRGVSGRCQCHCTPYSPSQTDGAQRLVAPHCVPVLARSPPSVPAASAALHCGALHHSSLRQAASLTRDTELFLQNHTPGGRGQTPGTPVVPWGQQAPPSPASEGRVWTVGIMGNVVLRRCGAGGLGASRGVAAPCDGFVTPTCM